MIVKTVPVGYLNTNCYIVEKDDKCIIIDPGDDFDIIVSSIDKNVVGILITHNHFDHVGALLDIKNKYNVKVYDYNNLKEGINSISNFKFEVIYTSGHTSDSVTYYFKEDNIMFTGDFLFKDTVGRTDLDTGNDEDMLNSIKKIMEYSNDIKVYPGHGEMTNLGYEKENNIYFRRLL